MKSNLFKRATTGVVFVALLTACVWLGAYTFAGLFLLISLLTLWEFYALVRRAGYRSRQWLGLCIGALIFTLNAAVFMGFLAAPVLTAQLPLMLLLFIAGLFVKKDQTSFANAFFSVGGLIYIILPFACFVSMGFAAGNYNYEVPLGFLVLLWVYDTGAYLTGSLFGRHQLLERISPKKSWEGLVGGLLICCSVAAQLSKFFTVITSLEWIGMAVVIVIFGTLGDLVESMFKRNLAIKDSGNLLPGHGGLLDRFDSLLLAAPFVYAFLILL